MKRLLLASALALLPIAIGYVPAQANIVWNGNFDLGAVGWGTGNSQHNLSGATVAGQTAIGASNQLVANEYQIVDAAHLNDGPQYTQYSTSQGQQWPSMPTNENGTSTQWTAGSTSETYTFSYQYYIPVKGSATVTLMAYTAAGPVPYNVNLATYNQMPGGAGWDVLYSQTWSVSSGGSGGWVTIDVPVSTISGMAPEYFAIILGKGSGTGTAAYFDSISLDVQTPTPTVAEPGALALLGFGVLGLGLLRHRRDLSGVFTPTHRLIG